MPSLSRKLEAGTDVGENIDAMLPNATGVAVVFITGAADHRPGADEIVGLLGQYYFLTIDLDVF